MSVSKPNTVLITFGCSWVYGVGAGYTQGMDKDQYFSVYKDPVLCDQYSFRTLLCKKYNMDNINFSSGGSSNQRQFRLAKEFFADNIDRLHNEYENIAVIWGITSTARNEMYSLKLKEMQNFKYGNNWGETPAIADHLIRHVYDHDNEVAQLATEMRFWNKFFEVHRITNRWFDIFNHHNYPTAIAKMMDFSKTPRDLLSKLYTLNGGEDIEGKDYHHSDWMLDSVRVKFLVNLGILNPISYHPTALGHQQIASMMSEVIDHLPIKIV